MNGHYLSLKRGGLLALVASFVTLHSSFFISCSDDYDLDDEGNYPSWLGGSIYEALSNPQTLNSSTGETLEGTFQNYVRLIDDLGYTETLGKTGSKTVFPANDDAFTRFFQNNSWGVSKYEDLTPAMKRQLLYGSMLDNALLVEMLSNVSNGNTAVTQGQALKHTTGANVIDTITYMQGTAQLPQNNSYWAKYADKGIYYVMDATRPMMVHFTEEQMTANNITTQATTEGGASDFEVITGSPYDAEAHSAYIFRNKIVHADVTCKNGYIHQMQDVLVPPGNLAELIRTNGESKLFSRMLDRFSAPYYSAATTNNYNDYAQANGLQLIDSIFQKCYMGTLSQGSVTGGEVRDPNGVTAQYILKFDPGWNTYGQNSAASASTDIAAIFVPTDNALEHYFLPGGEGEFLINTFGKKPNTADNLAENIDSIPLQNVQQLVNNLMQTSFVGTVPSKFGHVMDEASDPMGLSLDVINRNSDGTFDVKIANNGVAYMISKMFAPPSLIAVSAPVTLSRNMRVMNVAVYDGSNGSSPLSLGLNYYAYLLAMSANYAFFIPTDDAFQRFYVDPAYLGEDQPRALKFYYSSRSPYVFCSQWKYDPLTGEVGDSIGMVATSSFRSQLTDILNYHTIVLPKGEKLGKNRYYKTKHGGEIYFTGDNVASGAQLPAAGSQSANFQLPTPSITQVYNQKNGTSYAIDRLIQAPQQSVLSVLQAESTRFSEFLALCNDFDMDDIMGFASDKLTEVNSVTNKKRMDAYHTFAAKGGLTDNVNYFNTYNYTVYAPDNDAMELAYSRGLPKWSDIKVLYDQYNDLLEEQRAAGSITEEVQAARDKALAMVEEINGFIRYHFQDNSVYADNVIDAGTYPTACSDTLGIREKLIVSGGAGKFTVTDKRGQQITIDAANTAKVVNQMTRDYVLNKTSHTINTSSFAVIHQISTPLSTHADTDRYDALWTGGNARQKLAAYRRLYDEKLYRRYDEEKLQD